MNIFALDLSPLVSAKHLVDRHTVKMPLESAQMLANCFSPEILASDDCPRTSSGTVRKHCHFNHPCSKWVRESRGNMEWLISHAEAIDVERVTRYSSKAHFVMPFIEWCFYNISNSNVPDGKLTEFAMAMPDEYKVEGDPHQSYKNYYKFGKVHLHDWKRNKPDWI